MGRLTQLCSTATTVMLAILMPTLDCTTDMPDTPMPTTTARGLLMLRLMPTTDTTATDLTATVTDMVATEDTTGDKSQYLKAQSEHHSLLSDFSSFSAPPWRCRKLN